MKNLAGKKCSVSVGGDGKCGAPAVTSFKNGGVTYYECERHAPAQVAKPKPAPRIRPRPDGLDVPVGYRIGRDFPE